MDFISTCRQMIAIDSSPKHGNHAVALYAADLCREAGLQVELQEETLDGLAQVNVIARTANAGRGGEMMWQAPLDTVDPGAYGLWTETEHNPFNATIRDGKIFGIGAANAKLDFLCKLDVLKEARAAGRPLPPLVLVGTYGRERGMAGAVRLLRKKKISARWALVGGASNLRLLNSARGAALVEIVVPFSISEKEYRVRHDEMESSSSQSRIFTGSVASGGDETNAILKMLRYLAQLPQGVAVLNVDGGNSKNAVPAVASLEVDVAAELVDSMAGKLQIILAALEEVLLDCQNHEPRPTVNLAMVRGKGEAVRLVGNCRWSPAVNEIVYDGWMAKIAQASERAGAQFSIQEYIRPLVGVEESAFAQLCRQELDALADGGALASAVGEMSDATEANVFNRLGVESFMFGPGACGVEGNTANEFVELAQLESAKEFYRRVLERYSQWDL